jgi:hypothetical protein
MRCDRATGSIDEELCATCRIVESAELRKLQRLRKQGIDQVMGVLSKIRPLPRMTRIHKKEPDDGGPEER